MRPRVIRFGLELFIIYFFTSKYKINLWLSYATQWTITSVAILPHKKVIFLKLKTLSAPPPLYIGWKRKQLWGRKHSRKKIYWPTTNWILFYCMLVYAPNGINYIVHDNGAKIDVSCWWWHIWAYACCSCNNGVHWHSTNRQSS